MKNLNICIDIDGTITEPYYWLDAANKYFNINVSKDSINKYDIAECLDVDRDDYNLFYEKNKFSIHSNEKLRSDVKPILDSLYQNNNLYFVTARDKSLELLSNQYLIKHEIPHDGVFVLGSYNKVPTAEKLNCDIFIEDSYENAMLLSKHNIDFTSSISHFT